MTNVGHNSGDAAASQRHVVTVSLPTALVRLFPGSPNQVQIEARDVAEVVDGLEERWPGMRDRLTDSRPSIRKHLNIFVGADKAQLDTPVSAGTKVTILTAMSGG
ncbi:MAG: molybdopterin synthase sulfur carrier subunit [Alphaproteobacteria bacterium BRH_c36]|nr:MAG: molybdopterin synthase sulfur carrier subunit [Alphaproteobacteria bacterium BRH_c36]